ncbi:MAG TPA: TonB-dependent receptor [Hyphomonadaceae bacterium]|nr:TonB-dependent receptor [Hyphomonadaceae bacterium]
MKRYTHQGNYYNRLIESERISDYTENRAWFSNEINFLSTWDGPLQVVAGLYQYQENYTQTVFVGNAVDPGGPVYGLNNLLAFGDDLSTPLVPLPILPTRTGRTAASGTPVGESLVLFTSNQNLNNAYGAFIQSDYQINDQWKLTAGLRWSTDRQRGREYARYVNHYVVEESLENGFLDVVGPGLLGLVTAIIPPRVDLTSELGGVDPATGQVGRGVLNANPTSTDRQEQVGIYLDAATGNRYRDLAASWEEVTGVLGIDWTPDDDTLIYGKYNRGYKPGGLGAQDVYALLQATPYTDQELVDAYEIGFKRDWKDWYLTTNAVAFLYDYKGYQVPNGVVPVDPDGSGPLVRPLPYTSYVNLPETTISGFELETMWYPTDSLRFILNYGFTNPEIGTSPALVHGLDPYAMDPAAQPLGPPADSDPDTCGGPACLGQQGQSVEGNLLPYSPKHKVALNTTYTWDFEDGSKIDASVSYFWQDISFTSIFNRSYTKVPSFDQTDGRVSWTNADGNITLIGWVKNVFDEVQWEVDGVDASLREGLNKEVAPTLCESTPATTAPAGGRPATSCYTTSEQLRLPRSFGAELQIRF